MSGTAVISQKDSRRHRIDREEPVGRCAGRADEGAVVRDRQPQAERVGLRKAARSIT